MSAPVDVAVAVLIRSDGAALLAQRPETKVYSGYWEFPGGKIEPGEPVPEALRREVREELGIEVERAYPWITRVFVYPHAKVRLHFYRVYAWRGEPRAIEHQAIAWQRPSCRHSGQRGRVPDCSVSFSRTMVRSCRASNADRPTAATKR